MRVIISSLVGASLLAAFAAVGSGLISGVYEQTKDRSPRQSARPKPNSCSKFSHVNRTTTRSSMTALLSKQKTPSSL